MSELSPEEMLRYSRHLALPEVGSEGQRKLKDASVLCVGAGGLGSPLSLYLAAAGVGKLGLVEFDAVEVSNIQRQVLYATEDVGRAKLDAAVDRLSALNPGIEVVPHAHKLTADNVADIIADYDIVADGTDNFPTRYLVNDACVFARKPNVYGSVFRFEGQVSVFDAARGPCYRCLFPEPPPPGSVPSCAEGGVLGVLPGIIGTLQALEALKLILGEGEPLLGRLVLFDALGFEFREIKLRKDPACVVCGETPTVTSPIDYDAFCGVERDEEGVPMISPEAFAALDRSQDQARLLDVRNPYEYDIAHIPDTTLIPLDELGARVQELDADHHYVITCHHGPRAVQAMHLLRAAGFRKLSILEGGIDAWARRIDPTMPRYG